MAMLTRENLQRTFKRVRANQGAAGVDGLDIDQTAKQLMTTWPVIREHLLQVLQPLLDPTFSEHSDRFRPGRRAHDAVLAAHGHCFDRYADDCNVYVCSRKAGVKRRAADKPMATFKQRIRQLTRRSGGRVMANVMERLKPYLLGWKAYFGLAQTPNVWRTPDEWLRHRLRAIQFKHWRRGSTIDRELINLGAAEHVATRVAGNSRCWWRNSNGDIKRVLTIAYFDTLGVPRLS